MKTPTLSPVHNTNSNNSPQHKYGTFNGQSDISDASHIDETSIYSVSSLKTMWDNQSKKKSRRKAESQSTPNADKTTDGSVTRRFSRKPKSRQKLKGQNSAEINYGFSKRNAASAGGQNNSSLSDRPVSVHDILSGDSHDSLSDSCYDYVNDASLSPEPNKHETNNVNKQSNVKRTLRGKSESFLTGPDINPVNCCPIL